MKKDLLAEVTAKLEYELREGDGRVEFLLSKFEADRTAFASLTQSDPLEATIQSFLEEHPVVLLHAMLDGFYPVASTRSVLFPKVQLGAEYETDFGYCSMNSMGMWWTFVELELANVPIFTKRGDPSRHLSHAIRQVADWQSWVSDNAAYAQTKLGELVASSPMGGWPKHFRRACSGLIVIGRRAALTQETNRLRAQLCTDNPRLEIVTYDRLFDDYAVGMGKPLNESKDEVRTIREIEE